MTRDADPPTTDFALAQYCNLALDSSEPGHCTGTVAVDLDKHANPNGVVHGAVLFTLADTSMGGATMSVLAEGEICASIEVQLRFLRPVTGGTIHADTRVIHHGRRIVQLESHLTDGDGRLVATAAGSFAVIQPR